jgi:molybdopterin molybdotransferase
VTDAPLPVDAARTLVLSRTPRLSSEELALVDAQGRILVDDVDAKRAIPAFDNSAMDGVGVRAADVAAAAAAAPVELRIVGASLPGGAPLADEFALGAGQCVRIMTGGPIPAGVDAVVMRESCDESRVSDGVMLVKEALLAGANVRRLGEDVPEEGEVGRAGDVITPARLNLLASAGIVRVRVVRRARVAVLASGDELREIGAKLSERDVPNSNAHGIAASLRALGCDVTLLGIAGDSLDAHVEKMQQARGFDVLVTIGGVSMGTHDFVRPALEKLGATLEAWKVAMRPGKPIAFAHLVNHGGDTRVFGLPGNPVSAQVSFVLFVAPALAAMQGRTRPGPRTLPAVLTDDVKKKRGLEHYLRGAWVAGTDGTRRVRVLGKQGSHQISALADADCLVRIAADVEHARAGDVVACIPLEGSSA